MPMFFVLPFIAWIGKATLAVDALRRASSKACRREGARADDPIAKAPIAPQKTYRER